MKSDKRLPTLADRFLAHRYSDHGSFLAPGVIAELQRKTRLARKFRFDDTATTRVAHVVRDIPELIIREHAFARAPFDLCWIEYEGDVFWREVGNPSHLQSRDADKTIGLLIDHNEVTMLIGGTIEAPMAVPHPTTLRYHINTEWPERERKILLEKQGADAEWLDNFMWGNSYHRLDPALRSRLGALNCVSPMPYSKYLPDRLYSHWLTISGRSAAGDMRVILALLLMLNRPTVTRYDEVDAGRGWIKNKHVPYMAHTTITIDLDAGSTMRLLGTPAGDGVPRRRHEVRGHFCHDHTSRDYLRIAGCIHDWQATALDEEIPDFPIRWECAACGGKRWWKHQHERGDASRGWVSHDYNVTA